MGVARWVQWLGGHGASGAGRFALTRWFGVVGALAIGLFSLGMGSLLSRFIETRMLERDAAVSRDFAQSIANIQQVTGFFRHPQVAAEPSVAEFFAHVAAMPDVIRANVYGPDRRVIWSSRAELIGKVFPANDELDRSLHGEVVVNLEDDDDEAPKAEHVGLARPDIGFVENYLPMFDEQAHAVIGVIELYRQPAALLAAIQSGQRQVWLGAVFGGLSLFLVLVWFVRRTEQVLEGQRTRLVEAEALAMVGELAAAVAHSIRNPLGSIRSSAELQREFGGDAAGVNAEIMHNVDRVETLVRTLLTYASDPAERQASANLAAVLREAAARFVASIESHGKTLVLDIAPDLGSVAADPVVLAQVFNSVLANAVEATSTGDSVRVRAERQGGLAQIDVSDSGSGIAPEQVDDIFKPFFTTKPRGMGLGLPLVRRILDRLGGQVEITSRPGEGTRVRLQLPLLP